MTLTPTHGAATVDDPPILDPADPMPATRELVSREYSTAGCRTLHRIAGQFYAFNGRAYRPADDATVRAEVWRFLERALRVDKDEIVAFKPTKSRVDNCLDALRALTTVPDVKAPAWLHDAPGRPSADQLAVVGNGLLDLNTGGLSGHTPELFAVNELGCDYLPDAPPPERWLQFLAELWPDDGQAIQTLQDVAGYLLAADTSQQKVFLIVGPKRSGKGTVARVLTALLGKSNVCAPTLSGLSTNFGLAPLIDKPLAIISDARLSGRADQATIAERLLSISGEDGITIDRKHREAWTGTLPTRFVILTNELPRLADSSGALASRFIVLTLRNSFYGREDHGLTDRLLDELPGVLNWALAGRRRLARCGRFAMPESSKEAMSELEDLGSPISAFIRDRCVVAPGRSVVAKALFNAWRQWCIEEGRDHPGTAQSFGRDLRAAAPGVRVTQPRAEGCRLRFYEGIDLEGGDYGL